MAWFFEETLPLCLLMYAPIIIKKKYWGKVYTFKDVEPLLNYFSVQQNHFKKKISWYVLHVWHNTNLNTVKQTVLHLCEPVFSL